MIHLHLHTEHSTLDGMGTVRELLETAKSLGQNAMAITDHGSTSGLWEAQCIGDELGMKIIHGNEFYYERENDGKNGHLLILAKNDVGLKNIFKMQEISYVENFYRRPRINWDILKTHSEGLIVTSACLGSPFNQMIMKGDVSGATEWARKYKDVFGEDFYIEIQANSIPEQHLCNTTSIRIAEQLDIELVATNDVHYTLESDCFPHEVMLAMQVNAKMSNEKRFKFPADDFWLKSEEEMYDGFASLPQDKVTEAIKNTHIIAEKCNARIKKGKYLPNFYDVPEGKSQGEYLRELTYERAKVKGKHLDHDYMDDTDDELEVIEEGGYSGYFLIVDDYIRSERAKGGLVGDGRGSSAGSKVAFLNDITTLDPDEYGLLFERFMAKGRSPDIDTDFADQDSVFEDLVSKYGEDSVARIVAFARMGPRSVVRKVLSAFEHDAHTIRVATRLIPEDCKTLDQAYKLKPELLEYKEKFKEEWDVIERLQGIKSHETTHAAGVIIYPQLGSMLPVKTLGEDRSKRIVAWDMDMIEDVGFYKFDVLGLETLPVVAYTLDSIENMTGERVDLESINYEDPEVYAMLSRGEVSGVFQLAAQSQKVMEQKPENFTDLIAINALVRPGVGDWSTYLKRRRGEEEWEVYEPRRSYMDSTYGTMTYQEQYLWDGHMLAGWDVAFADKHLRKNRDIRNDTELKKKFIDDCVSRGHDKVEVEEVWSEIEDAVDGGYGFNLSHSAAYAKLSFKTAWLKYYFPEHFYAALMSGAKTDGEGQDKISGYIAECKQRGIKILPPHINDSGDNFVPTSDGINYRITAIKHVGDSAIKHINELRPISGFDDLLERREKRYVNKAVVTNLVKAGCFDFEEPNRALLLWKFAMSERTKTQIKEDLQLPMQEFDDSVKAEWEMEVLGMYLSVHPLEQYGFKELSTYSDGGVAMQGGEIYDMHVFYDKNKNEMAFVDINTLFGNVKLVIFSRDWAQKKLQEACVIGNIVMVQGRRSGNDMLVDTIEVLRDSPVV